MGSSDELFQVSVKGRVEPGGISTVQLQIDSHGSKFSLDIAPASAEALGLAIINMSKKVQIGARLVSVAESLLGSHEHAVELARVLTDGENEEIQIEVIQ